MNELTRNLINFGRPYKTGSCESDIQSAFISGTIKSIDIKYDSTEDLWTVQVDSPVDDIPPSISKSLEWAVFDQLQLAHTVFHENRSEIDSLFS